MDRKTWMNYVKQTGMYLPLIATISTNLTKPMYLWFELPSLAAQFYQLGFSIEFLNSIGFSVVLDKNRATNKSNKTELQVKRN